MIKQTQVTTIQTTLIPTCQLCSVDNHRSGTMWLLHIHFNTRETSEAEPLGGATAPAGLRRTTHNADFHDTKSFPSQPRPASLDSMIRLVAFILKLWPLLSQALLV